MDTVTIDGITYTKVSLLAKKFRYTTDYIGQLCRADKLDCQLVGRSWYADENALLAHKDTRYKQSRLSEKTSNIKVNALRQSDENHIAIRSRKVTKVGVTDTFSPTKPIFSHRGASTSRYLPDEADLLPLPVQKSKIIVPSLPEVVEPPQTSSIKIKTVTGGRENLAFTPLPSVILQGNLPVSAVDVPDSSLVTEPRLVPTHEVAIASVVPAMVFKAPVKPRSAKPLAVSPNVLPVAFSPSSVATLPRKQPARGLLLVAFFTASLMVAFLLSSEQSWVITTAGTYAAGVGFSTASWVTLWATFLTWL